MDSLENSGSKGMNPSTSTLSPKNTNRRRSTVFTIVSVFIIFVIVTAFVSYRISSTISQTSNSGTGLTISHDHSLLSSPEHTQNPDIQASHVITDARESDTIINYNEFKQEAQNILFREEEEVMQAQSNSHSVAHTVSTEGFRTEADKTLYRESNY